MLGSRVQIPYRSSYSAAILAQGKEKMKTKHELIPSHEKLYSEEKEKLLKEMNINFKDLPKIFKSDPAIAELNVKSEDVIKITRKSATAKESSFYRGVIDA